MAYSKNVLEKRKTIFEIEKETRQKAIEWLKNQKK